MTRYDEVVEALLDERLSSDFRTSLTPEQRANLQYMPEEIRPLAYSLLMLDPPDHTRLRKLVQPNFTARTMETLRPRIQRIADTLLDQVERAAAERGEREGERRMDLLHTFAYPMPITVISDMLGIPEEDRTKVHGWAESLLGADRRDAAMDELRRGSLREFARYLDGLFERKRREPTEDMISQMVHAQDEGDKLNHQEMVSMVFILFFAGHVTTVNLIGSGVVALLTHPEQLERFLADPANLSKGAVEETLRYWGPVDYMSTPRIIKEEMELAGTHLPQGEKLSVGLASANRDPQHFPNPDVFDITRPNAHRNRPSARASTSALARPWPAWRGRSPSRPCSGATRACAWRCPSSRCGGTPAPACAASTGCPSSSSPQRPAPPRPPTRGCGEGLPPSDGLDRRRASVRRRPARVGGPLEWVSEEARSTPSPWRAIRETPFSPLTLDYVQTKYRTCVRRPHFDLEQVKRLAEEDRFALGSGSACIRALKVYLHGEMARYRPFAQGVIRGLSPADFWRSKRWPEPDGELADEYGIQLPVTLMEEFEVDVSTGT
ncbi:cytochrome P450 [Cystobacter fuscus]